MYIHCGFINNYLIMSLLDDLHKRSLECKVPMVITDWSVFSRAVYFKKNEGIYYNLRP